ncbi:hypothetical protein ACFW04_010324 [Cataglyphis niger]
MKLMFALMIIVVVLSTTVTADGNEDDDYIHLPGKTCEDAPSCPDNRPCVMEPPRCNVGTCGKDPVPTCGKKP